MRFSVDPVGPGAAEITGIDCSQTFSDDLFELLKGSFQTYPFLVFRGQNLSAPELAAFGGKFGQLDHYNNLNPIKLQASQFQATSNQMVYLSPDAPNVLVMTNEIRPESDLISIVDDAGTWHADASYRSDPYKAILLHAVSNAATGGETEFCDLQALFDFMPASLKATLSRQYAVHHWSKYRNPHFAKALDSNVMEESERIASLIPEMLHPLVCIHPETGHPHLYLSPRFTIRIEGLAEEISAALLKNLFEFMEDPRFIYRHTWREKDLVIWDNRRLNHRVLSYPADNIRCRQRVTILGEPVSGYSLADGQADS